MINVIALTLIIFLFIFTYIFKNNIEKYTVTKINNESVSLFSLCGRNISFPHITNLKTSDRAISTPEISNFVCTGNTNKLELAQVYESGIENIFKFFCRQLRFPFISYRGGNILVDISTLNFSLLDFFMLNPLYINIDSIKTSHLLLPEKNFIEFDYKTQSVRLFLSPITHTCSSVFEKYNSVNDTNKIRTTSRIHNTRIFYLEKIKNDKYYMEIDQVKDRIININSKRKLYIYNYTSNKTKLLTPFENHLNELLINKIQPVMKFNFFINSEKEVKNENIFNFISNDKDNIFNFKLIKRKFTVSVTQDNIVFNFDLENSIKNFQFIFTYSRRKIICILTWLVGNEKRYYYKSYTKCEEKTPITVCVHKPISSFANINTTNLNITWIPNTIEVGNIELGF